MPKAAWYSPTRFYFASQAKPKLLVDYATLTGACIGALSTRLSGTLTNREKLVPILIEAGNASGERVWPFPLPKDYEDALKSDIADIKQCTLDSDADHILAATFLKSFWSTIRIGCTWICRREITRAGWRTFRRISRGLG